MIKLAYKLINEENSVYMEFDGNYELEEFLDDKFNLNIESLTNDNIRDNHDNIELIIINNTFNKTVVIDYLR